MQSLLNQRFGKLVVTSDPFYRTNPSGRVIPFCSIRCDCGTERDISMWKLTTNSKPSRSCGCDRLAICSDMLATHRGSGTRLHAIWKGIRSRCNNPNRKNYPDYGGRGITLCPAWDDFAVFREWALANGYSDQLTIDRIDPDGNYEPGNCRWVTVSENTAHKNAHYVTVFGQRKSLKDWASDPRCVVAYGTLKHRIGKCGWDAERAITSELQSSCKCRQGV